MIRREQRLKELEKEKYKISEEIHSIHEEICAEKEKEKRRRIDTYMKNPYYKGILNSRWLRKPVHGEQDVYIKLLSECDQMGAVTCLVVCSNMIGTLELPLFSPKEFRKLMTQTMLDTWVIEDYISCAAEEFWNRFEDVLSNLRS